MVEAVRLTEVTEAIDRLADELRERLHLTDEEMEALRALLLERKDGIERRLDES